MQNSGYSHHGASRSKRALVGWLFGGGSPIEDIDANLSTLQQRGRDLYMGVPLATGAIKRLRTSVVGAGLQLKSQPDAETLGISQEEAYAKSRIIEREFRLFSGIDCDIARQNKFAELQQLAMLAWPMSGDVFALLPIIPRPHSIYDLRIKLLEADRVCNPGVSAYSALGSQVQLAENGNLISQGVEVTPEGEVVAYHVAQRHPLSLQFSAGQKQGWERVEIYGRQTGRRNIIHLFNAERPEQHRGVPLLSPVIETLKQLGRYTDAELIAAVVSGMFTAFITSDTPQTPLGESVPLDQQVAAGDPNSIEMGNAAVIGLNPGEKVETANPGRPNTAFDGFVTALARFIGAALEIPYEVLMMSFNSSYSASRAALLEFWKMCRMFRSWLAQGFCQPVFEEFLAEAVAKGRIDLPGFFDDPIIRQAWCNAVWNGPAPGHIQPLQEAKAAEMRIALAISTGAQEAQEANGSDIYANIRENGQENQARIAQGLPPLGVATPTIEELNALVAAG
jgi:lambda family phage portal protein